MKALKAALMFAVVLAAISGAAGMAVSGAGAKALSGAASSVAEKLGGMLKGKK